MDKKIAEIRITLTLEYDNREDLKKELDELDKMLQERQYGWTNSEGYGIRKWKTSYLK